MRHFPIYLDMAGARVVVSGAGETAVAKLRLLLKTEADIAVFGPNPAEFVRAWAGEGRLRLTERPLEASNLDGVRLLYAANDDEAEDARVRLLGRSAGVLVNVVDNLYASDFITPAIVDRDPVTIAIGTEGTAPVLARRVKAEIEALLPPSLGILARAAAGFRHAVEQVLPMGARRRAFWARYFGGAGGRVLEDRGAGALAGHLEQSLARFSEDGDAAGRVDLVGAGPGDPELLTLKARNALHEADVVLYDRLTDPRILELARREAILIETGKAAGGSGWPQDGINAEMIAQARAGHHVVRLKSGDPLMFGRADEEMDALDAAGVPFAVVPGITAAVAAAAGARTSLTRRGRNTSVRFLTAHDVAGYAKHDWKALAAPGAVFAVYMSVRAVRFLQGRLLLHGAAPGLPVTVVENVSRPDETRVATTLGALADAMAGHDIHGPAVILVGVRPRAAAHAANPEFEPADAGETRVALKG